MLKKPLLSIIIVNFDIIIKSPENMFVGLDL